MERILVSIIATWLGVFAISAMAAKPNAEIRLIAGPHTGFFGLCTIANNTDRQIDVSLEFCNAPIDNSATVLCEGLGPVSQGLPSLFQIGPGYYQIGGEFYAVDASSVNWPTVNSRRVEFPAMKRALS